MGHRFFVHKDRKYVSHVQFINIGKVEKWTLVIKTTRTRAQSLSALNQHISSVKF